MNNNHEKPRNLGDKRSRRDVFWNLFLTGGFSTFEKEWRSSKSPFHTFLLFLVPIFGAGLLFLLVIVALRLFN
ncbi:hypothetical protein [Bacillus sp. PS06]|uniref:hypothetical protein n=1 Tax=Bacillus sp. PS06 TaxID=2764176 RepID=UPI00177D8DF7|nr:hypothetical protein [Bacillus sp. PS06]MBD8071168.1 hypothetical protein [Bacillus sp. PS06]